MEQNTLSSTSPTAETAYEQLYLSWIDYFVLSSMLIISFLVGIYFGFVKNKAGTTLEYLLGGKSVNVLPIALSLVATQISGTTIIALPADIYKFGSNYIWTLLSEVLSFLVMMFIFLPVFFNLQLVSIFEYLELRFDKRVRRLTSVINVISTLTYCPIVVYIPALAFSQVAGVDIYTITIAVSATCIIYTTFGGFKAVVWTDTLQFAVMVGSVIVVLIIGAKSVGGLDNAIGIANENNRFDIFNFSVNLTTRNTVWGPLVGHLFFSLSVLAVNQNCVQKYLALSTFKSVKTCLLIHLIGSIIIKLSVFLLGNVVFAKYIECDVFKSKKIKKTDQLIPYFVMDITKKYPGLPGLFFAGLFSAALSTLSSSLNGVAASIHKDLILPFIPNNTTEKVNTRIIKAVVAILGIICVLLVFIVEKIGGLFAFSSMIQGISGGPMLGIFILGLLFPTVNAKETLIGALSSMIFTGWMICGNTWYRTQNLFPNEEQPRLTEKCETYSNQTVNTMGDTNDVFILYQINFWYYTLISTAIVVCVGVIVSLFTNKSNVTIEPKLVSSTVHYFLPKKVDSCVYFNVKTEETDIQIADIKCNESGGTKTNNLL